MAVRIAVGGENFVTLPQNGSYYVDKTELLYWCSRRITQSPCSPVMNGGNAGVQANN